jgi:hypothetical protein
VASPSPSNVRVGVAGALALDGVTAFDDRREVTRPVDDARISAPVYCDRTLPEWEELPIRGDGEGRLQLLPFGRHGAVAASASDSRSARMLAAQ